MSNHQAEKNEVTRLTAELEKARDIIEGYREQADEVTRLRDEVTYLRRLIEDWHDTLFSEVQVPNSARMDSEAHETLARITNEMMHEALSAHQQRTKGGAER